MHEQLIVALVDRIKNGDQKENLHKEVLAAGYTLNEFEAAYTAAHNRITSQDTPAPAIPVVEPAVPVEPEPVNPVASPVSTPQPEVMVQAESPVQPASVVQEDQVSHISQSELLSEPAVDKSKMVKIIFVVFVAILALAGVAAAGWYALNHFGGPVARTVSIENAPYDSESELVAQFINTAKDTVSANFSAGYGVVFEEKTDDIVYKTDRANELMEDIMDEDLFIPYEGSAGVAISGAVDVKEEGELPDFEVVGELTVDLEPIIFKIAASGKLVDKKGYVQISDMPVIFEPYVEKEVMPVGVWLETGSVDDIEDEDLLRELEYLIPPLVLEELRPIAGSLAQLTKDAVNYHDNKQAVAIAGQHLAQLVQVVPRHANQMAAAYGGVNSFQANLMIDAYTAAVKEHPPIKFVGDVTVKEVAGEEVYSYRVDIDARSSREMVRQFMENVGQDVSDRDMDRYLPEDNFAEAIAAINELIDIELFVNADGTPAGAQVTFIFSNEQSKGQARAEAFFVWTGTDKVSIKAPRDLHHETLVEIENRRRELKKMEQFDRMLLSRLSSFRYQASSYNRTNGSSYLGFCEAVMENRYYANYFEDGDVTCEDTVSTFRAYGAFKLKDGYACVDGGGLSAGAYGETPDQPDSRSAKCPASTKYGGSSVYF